MKRSFYKMLLSYVLVSLIPLVIMGILSYWWIGNIVKNQVEQSYEAAVNEVKDSVDRRFEELDGFVVQMSYMPWIQKLMYMQGPKLDTNRIQIPELTNYVMEMRGYDAINDFIDTASIILPEKQLVISSMGTANTGVFFNELYKLGGTEYSKLQDIINTHHTSTVLLPDVLHIKDSQPVRVLTYIQSIPSADQKPHAVFMTYIKENMLMSVLEGKKISESSTIYVLNNKRKTIVSVNGQDKSLLKTIKSQYIKDGEYKDSKSGERYFVFRKVSSFNNWEYIITIPYKVVMAKVDYIKSATILLAIILSIVGFVFSYFFTTHNYNPLWKLVDAIKAGVSYKYPVGFNVYDFLRESIHNLLNEESQLRKEAEQQKPLIRNAYFLKLLNGDDVWEESVQILKPMDVTFPFQYYTAILLVLSTTKGNNSDIRSKEVLAKLGSYPASTYFVEVSAKRKVAIINADSIETINEMVSELKWLIEHEILTKCIAVVGKSCTSLKDIADSYKSALVAADYRLVHGKTDIIFFNDIKQANTIYYYPIDKEEKLLNLLRAANYDEVLITLREIVSKNTENDLLSLNSVKCLFYDLIGTALKTLNDLCLNDSIIIDQNYIAAFDTMAEMENYLAVLYKNICVLIGDRKKCPNETLKDSIKTYIDENYDKQDLSLETVSRAIGISVGYLSKFFKEQFEYNFLDYINRKRIKKAKELLTGQMTVSQIAQIVGYSNDVTFRRVFKKYEGLTPGAFIIPE